MHSNNCRGYRYNNVYIDHALTCDDDTFKLIITRLIPQRDKMGSYDVNWNWKEHVKYF